MKQGAREALSLTREDVIGDIMARAFVVCCRVVAALYVLAFALWYGLADGFKDFSGTPLGADFLNVYAAGILVDHGQAALAYDWGAHQQVEQAVVGYASSYFGWHYPPLFLAFAGLVACAPYLWAFALYIMGSFAGYFAVLRRLAPGTQTAFWAAAVFPGVFCNIANGQNGFITTTLFGLGFLCLEQNPWLAGIWFGLLAYKPQFFVVIPVVLAIGGYYRALLASVATALGGVALSWALFGTSVWQAFLKSTKLTQHIILEQGTTGWKKIQSVFSLARLWGCDITTSYALQGIVAALALLVTAWVWRRPTTLATRAAALCGAILLTTPYLLDYDLVILAVPIAFLARLGLETGFRAYEKILLALLWVLPLLARSWGDTVLLTPFLLIGLMGLCAARTCQSPSRAV